MNEFTNQDFDPLAGLEDILQEGKSKADTLGQARSAEKLGEYLNWAKQAAATQYEKIAAEGDVEKAIQVAPKLFLKLMSFHSRTQKITDGNFSRKKRKDPKSGTTELEPPLLPTNDQKAYREHIAGIQGTNHPAQRTL